MTVQQIAGKVEHAIATPVFGWLLSLLTMLLCLLHTLQDGDQYVVLWDEQLLQPRNSPAQDYTAAPPDQVGLLLSCPTVALSIGSELPFIAAYAA